MAVIEQARPLLCKLLDSYELRDIYNMDETGLFYRMQASNICTSAFYGLSKETNLHIFADYPGR